MNYEYMAMGRMLRDGRLPEQGKLFQESRRRSRPKQLIESWINGNRSFVLDEMEKMRPLEAALIAARLLDQTKDQSFLRALDARTP